MKDKFLISLVGATAIGKTDLAIRLAQHYHTDILSADSRQFYKEMYIGTAVPNPQELAGAKHHFIQDRSIFEDYSVGKFEKDATALLDELFQSRDIVIMVGGSGLYVDAVLQGLDAFPELDPGIREKLKQELNEGGIEPLQARLKNLDPISYERMDIFNKQRLIRALEICIGTGTPFSKFWKKNKKQRNFIPVKIGLEADRELVYQRINQRVDVMMQQGLLNEVNRLYPNRHLNALQTVGYKELFEYLEGNCSLEFAVSEIKKNTRRFAKRQGTWFRKDKRIKWFDRDAHLEEITSYIDLQIEKAKNAGIS